MLNKQIKNLNSLWSEFHNLCIHTLSSVQRKNDVWKYMTATACQVEVPASKHREMANIKYRWERKIWLI